MTFATAKSGAVDAQFNNFGVSATFIPLAEDPVDCTVILRNEEYLAPDGYQGQTMDRRKTIRYLVSDIDRDVERGEIFRVDGVDYIVTNIIETSNPDYSRKAAVKV